MKKFTWIIIIVLVFTAAAQLSAAPIYPDIKTGHWAYDAVTQLAAKGIIEGYPDGTFKGDRSATRWEMAVVVARLLAKDEQMWATFATKEDIENIKNLVNTLRNELDALGVNVSGLEEKFNKLQNRTSDLEKFKFYGSVDTVAASQYLKTSVTVDPWGFAPTSQYNIVNAIGSTVGPCVRPNGFANLFAGAPATYTAFPVVDFRNTRPLTKGGALTTVGTLGVKINAINNIELQTEFATYAGIGSDVVASYAGVTPPYLSNVFTSGVRATNFTNTNSSSWMNMTLDNLTLLYKPSKTKIFLGSFAGTNFDHEVLSGEPNPNAMYGPKVLPFYGFKVAGETYFLSPMKFEIIGSRVASDSTAVAANPVYNTIMSGFNLNWLFDGGDFKANFLRATNDYFSAAALQPGGAENPFAWQNPWEYRAAAEPQQRNRPVQAADAANGLIGPQSQTTMGASIRYKLSKNIKFEATYGTTQYKPNINSGYTVNGEIGRARLSGTFFNGTTDLAAEYVGTSAFYDPFINVYPAVVAASTNYGGGANLTRMPEPFYRIGLFSTGFYQFHDNALMTNNRIGLHLIAAYRLPNKCGSITARYSNLEQVGFSATMANGGLSNKPGFVEGIFPAMLGAETTKGKYEHMLIGADYKFPGTKLYAKVFLTNHRFKRPTALTNNFAANNNVNLTKKVANILLTYPINNNFLLRGGCDIAAYNGAFRVTGLPNWDYSQTIPFIGFDYKISDNTTLTLLAESFTTDDKVSPTVTPSGGSWKWSGNRILTEFKYTF